MLRLIVPTLLLLAAGCATVRPDSPAPPTYAIADPERTPLGRAFADRLAAQPGHSAFHILDSGEQAVLARAALADAAERTLDLQYFIVQEDPATALLMQRIVSAARRGVRVRILLDDLHGPNRKFATAAAAAEPRIEIRLFNPFLQRNSTAASRLFELLGDADRLNQRMHIKLWIADNAAAIFGGRNLGGEYFDAAPDTNFRDLDLLAAGPLVPELSRVFDLYWNSKWAVPVGAFHDSVPAPEDTARARAGIDERAAAAAGTALGDALAAGEFRRRLAGAELPFILAPAYPIYDEPGTPALAESHLAHLGPTARAILEGAKSEIILVSPYFVPSAQGLRFLAQARSRGVRIAVLTNSLASTDAVAAHAGYARYRADILRSAIELYEMRPEANASHARRSHRWIRSSGSSLHAKVLIVDRSTAFVGSMNLDPRSRLHNTELLVVVDSAELASRLAALFDEGMEPDHAFRVRLRPSQEGGDAIVWFGEEQGTEIRYETEPQAGFWKRLWSGVLSIIVPEHLL